MGKTKIEWCDETWNPVWGCHNDCPYCYAKKIARRFGKTPEERDFLPTWKEQNFNRKFAKATKRVFVNSMSDIQHWKPEWMRMVIKRIGENPDIQFIFLTKGGYDSYAGYDWPKNVVCGITVTTTRDLPHRAMGFMWPAKHWLLNIEPIHGSFECGLARDHAGFFDWIIIGAETGNRKEKVIPSLGWFEWMLEQEDIPVFVKPSMDSLIPHELIRREFI